MNEIAIDTTYDVRTDARGENPDAYSPTLRRYHQILWSKPLPSGHRFDLEFSPYWGLEHSSDLGNFYLTSDGIIHSYNNRKWVRELGPLVTDGDIEEFETIASTIGGYIVFPGNQIDRKMTINQALGVYRELDDRFDLTLECIRLHYVGRKSPLRDVLARYGDFFALFGTFEGYVQFSCCRISSPTAKSDSSYHLSISNTRRPPVTLSHTSDTETAQLLS